MKISQSKLCEEYKLKNLIKNIIYNIYNYLQKSENSVLE